MSYMKERAFPEEDVHARYQQECEERAWEDWQATLAADPYYPVWVESINKRTENEYGDHRD